MNFETDHAGNSVEPLNGVSKGGEHPLCDILIGAGVNTSAAKWLRLSMVRWVSDRLARLTVYSDSILTLRSLRLTFRLVRSRRVALDTCSA